MNMNVRTSKEATELAKLRNLIKNKINYDILKSNVEKVEETLGNNRIMLTACDFWALAVIS